MLTKFAVEVCRKILFLTTSQCYKSANSATKVTKRRCIIVVVVDNRRYAAPRRRECCTPYIFLVNIKQTSFTFPRRSHHPVHFIPIDVNYKLRCLQESASSRGFFTVA